MTTIRDAFQDGQVNADEARALMARAAERLSDVGQPTTDATVTEELTRMIGAFEATLPAQTIDEAATAQAIVRQFGGGRTGSAVPVVMFGDPAPAPARATRTAPAQPAAPPSRLDTAATEAHRAFTDAANRLRTAAAALPQGTITATVRSYTTSLRSELGVGAEARSSGPRTSPTPQTPEAPATGGTSTGGKGDAGGSTSTVPMDPAASGTAETGGNTTFTVFRAASERASRQVEIPDGTADADQRAAYLQALTEFTIAARQYVDAEALRGIRANGEGMQELQALGILQGGEAPYTRADVHAEMEQYRAMLAPVISGLGNVSEAYNDLVSVVAASAAATMSGGSPIGSSSADTGGTIPTPTLSSGSMGGTTAGTNVQTATGGK